MIDDGHNGMLETLVADGLVERGTAALKPLAGGVSSEIYLVTDRNQRFVVKRALEKLNVADEWFADVSRNQSEADYMEYVGDFAPDSVPGMFHRGDGYFAMEYLGDGFENWKIMLLAGDCRSRHAAMAAQLLAQIHARSRGDEQARTRFDNEENFFQLRIEPYLITTGKRCAGLQDMFEIEAKRLDQAHECLVHGDYSPKNIMIAGDRMVVLDCEVANYGDPAFDYCFLINHLLLKGLYHVPHDLGLETCVQEFREHYRLHCGLDEHAFGDFSARAGRLLAMLMLARVDGKSPVEYLCNEGARQRIRDFVNTALHEKLLDDTRLVARWFEHLRE